MPPPKTVRVTPARLLIFLLSPALILAGTFAVGELASGLSTLVAFAIVTAGLLGIGAAVTLAGTLLGDDRRRNAPPRDSDGG